VADARIFLVTGKGGVGKSTVAAALALRQARSVGAAVLIEVEDGRAAVRALHGEPGVRVVTVSHAVAMQNAITRLLRARLLAKAIVKQRSIARLLDTVPAIRELVVLEEVRAIAEEFPTASVIVDLPATGHAVDFLRVPAAAKRFLHSGPAAKMCDDILAQVLSPDRSAIFVVSTFETVVAQETRELCERLKDELGFPASSIVMNRAPRRVDPAALRQLTERSAHTPTLVAVEQIARARAAACEEAEGSLRLLAEFAPVTTVPEYFQDPSAADLVRELSW
jgi:anion-transporting  ArsA/GET3 family ATPase